MKYAWKESEIEFLRGKRCSLAVFEQNGGHMDHFMFTAVGVMKLPRPALLVLTKNFKNVIIFTILKLSD